MARRFTDTEKWRDEWWGSLSNDYRMIWLYLVDSCSIAGIWKKDFRGLNFNCNTSVDEKTFLEVFGARLVDKGNFFFMPKFLRFQCPKGLNSNKPAIISIVKELEQNNLIQTVRESLGNDFLIIKGKDKGKGTGEGKGEDKGKDNLVTVESKLDVFEGLFCDEIFIQKLTIAHKGKDLKQAFEECYMHHSNAPNPPRELWEWRQKLNSWLTIKGENKQHNGNGVIKNAKQQHTDSLIQGIAERYGTKANGQGFQGNNNSSNNSTGY